MRNIFGRKNGSPGWRGRGSGEKKKMKKKEKYDAMGKEEIKKYRKDRERMR